MSADHGRGTARYELPVDPGDAEIAAARLWAAGAMGVWERPGALVAWFGERTDLAPGAGSWTVEPDHDWQGAWKATIQPVRAGRFAIVPSWLVDEHEPADDEITLVLDPGRAFGSGHHATTTLCLELLEAIDADTGLAGRRVADIGCGTGVLGIAAAAKGARVDAVDIDPVAVRVTEENAARNRVRLQVHTGSVGVLDTAADVVVANLVSDVIIALADDLVAATAGDLVVSGISRERGEDVLGVLLDAGCALVERRERDGWVAARLRHGEVAG